MWTTAQLKAAGLSLFLNQTIFPEMGGLQAYREEKNSLKNVLKRNSFTRGGG